MKTIHGPNHSICCSAWKYFWLCGHIRNYCPRDPSSINSWLLVRLVLNGIAALSTLGHLFVLWQKTHEKRNVSVWQVGFQGSAPWSAPLGVCRGVHPGTNQGWYPQREVLHSTADISSQTITGVVLSLTLGCSSWIHLTSPRSRIYLHDLRTWYVQCLNFLMMQTIMFWWIGLMKHNSVVMKPPCANRWVKSLWSW